VPDPLADVEGVMLRHLLRAHPAELALLQTWVPACWRGADSVVRPLGLDRYGFRLRVEHRHGSHDVRVPFSVPVTSPDALGPAVHRLLCAAQHDSPAR
jgi:hypothetical protein